MKKTRMILPTAITILFVAAGAFARPGNAGDNQYDRPNHGGHPGGNPDGGYHGGPNQHGYPGQHDHQDQPPQHDGKMSDGDKAVAAGLGASLLSLSIESATRQQNAMLEQAEPEAIAFEENTATTPVFQSAKEIVEASAGKSLSDAEAAKLIVEYNQQQRAAL